MIQRIAVLAVLFLSAPSHAAQTQGRLALADAAGASALTASSAEGSSAFARRALEGGSVEGMTAVDASGASQAKTVNLIAAPVRAKAVVPPPMALKNSTSSDDHAGLFMLGALIAPELGAIAGAVVGGVPGAITGGLVGLAVGIVLLAVGIARALRHVFNP
jgi:hypothetical protein